MLTKTEYAARKAAIIKEWEGLPGMTAVLIAELDAGQREAAPASAPEPESVQRTARQSEYDALHWQARLAGKTDAEASRLAQAELDRRHTPALTDDDVRRRFGLPVEGEDDAEPDTRTMAELTADAEAFLNAGAWTAQPAGVSIERVQRHMAERSRVAARKAFADDQFRAIKGRNPNVADDIARGIAETSASAAHGPAEADLSD